MEGKKLYMEIMNVEKMSKNNFSMHALMAECTHDKSKFNNKVFLVCQHYSV